LTFWLALAAEHAGEHVLELIPTSSTPWGVNISRLGKLDSSTSISTIRCRAPARSLVRNFSRVSWRLSGVLGARLAHLAGRAVGAPEEVPKTVP
jgi:hypothetical protein